ncbi:nucleotidyl transferase AbiEii/AbiGii toxin family protein [Rhodocytophaga aerolata]
MPMLAYEAFLRRASQVNLPFMLKGSYVTRQYFVNPIERIPNDLDWVYLHSIADIEKARSLFDSWVIQVTETYERDGVEFQSFKENAFWRMLDYAMADDFPTINTDLKCWVDGEEFDWFGLDISFNLDVEVPPIPLLYTPLRGEPFTIPYTVPLSLQVAWKLHQTLVRPRFKDIFDLVHLLKHPSFDESAFEQTLKALIKECKADKVNIYSLQWLIDGKLQPLFKEVNFKDMWEFWRFGKSSKLPYDFYEKAQQITDADKLPIDLSLFVSQFQTALQQAGFNSEVIRNLPATTSHKHIDHRIPLQADLQNDMLSQTSFQDKKASIVNFLKRLFQ